MNFIDNIISVFNPQAALKRQRARMVMDILSDQKRKFDAAGRGRRTNGWPITDGSANTEMALSLVTLRARARDMVRNNSYAQSSIKKIVNNTVGTGILPQPVDTNSARVKKFKKLWREWAETKACDFNGKLTFYGIQRLVMRAVAESGEAIILKRRTGKFKLQLQVLEGDYLDHSKDMKQIAGGGRITQGVEYDKDDQIVAYWIFDGHPGEWGNYSSSRRPADDVIHVYELLRPGQARGIPFGISSLLRLKDYDDYEDAEVVRQKIAACFAAFVQDADPSLSTGDTEADMLEKLEPGVIEHLPPGKTIEFASPPTTNNYDNFSRKILQGIAQGYGITYEAMTGDLSNVNFSSGRMGWLEMSRQIQDWQYHMLIPQFCDQALEWFMEVSTIGRGFSQGDMYVTWTPPRREMIDPAKETTAIKDQIRTGIKSWAEAVREQGFDPDEMIEEIKAYNAKLDAAKIILESDARQDIKPKQQAPAEGGSGGNL